MGFQADSEMQKTPEGEIDLKHSKEGATSKR
jgi:hypothetical protein